ncbi:hypothetical protein, partial [Xanthomonas citri]|uniref:hypothetical protein n=1 Tax=Xanthomonas citri TaxID=346 RepID=UPI001A8F2966
GDDLLAPLLANAKSGGITLASSPFGPVLSRLRMASDLSPLSFLIPAAIDSKQSWLIGPTLQIHVA